MSGTNVPVLVGPVPLRYVQSMSVAEGYETPHVHGSRFVQLTQPARKEIGIKAVLIGSERFGLKKALEALALTSMNLAAFAVPVLRNGISVVSGLTISLDMQITNLEFQQSVERRDALDVSISLVAAVRPGLSAAFGEVADLAVAAGTAFLPGFVQPNPVARTAEDLF
nr:hypothetical protein [Amycolatopsis nigrescens]